MTELHEFEPQKKITVWRSLATLGALGVAGLTIAGAAIVPLPSYKSTPIVLDRQPAVAVDTKVCPGSALDLASNPSGDSLLYTPTGAISVITESKAERERLAGNREAGSGSPFRFIAAVGEVVNATQAQTPMSENVTGLVTTACNTPLREGWFVGASTTLGRNSILLLSNPSSVISQVKIDVKSIEGKTQSGEVVVDAYSQVAVSLASWIPGSAALAVRFETQGGLIAAQIQTNTVRGLETGGVDYLLPQASPSKNIVIPGIRIENLEETLETISSENYGDLLPRLVLWNTSNEPVDTEIYIIPSDEGAFGNEFSYQLAAGAVDVVDLNALETGSYSVHILGSNALVAVGSAGTKADSAIDFAWFDSAISFTGEEDVQTASAPNAQLTLVNPGQESATFSVPDIDFNTTLGSQEAVTLPVPSSTHLKINVTDGEISAGVTHSSVFGLSSYSVSPKPVAAEKVSLVSLY